MATAELEVARTAAAELTDALRQAQTAASALQARVDALALGLDRRDGTADLLAAGADAPGLLGGVADAIAVTPGHETAIAAALGAVADAVAVRSVGDAAAALDLLRSNDSGRAGILIQGTRSRPDRRCWPDLPAGVHWAIDLIGAPESLLPALARTLDLVAVVPDAATAIQLIDAFPDVRCGHRRRRRDRSRLGQRRQRRRPDAAGDPGHPRPGRGRVGRRAGSHRGAGGGAGRAKARGGAQPRRPPPGPCPRCNESDAHISAVAEELARYGSAARAAAAEANRLAERRQAAETAREQHRQAVEDLQDRLAAVESEQTPVEVDTSLRDELADGRRPGPATGGRGPAGAPLRGGTRGGSGRRRRFAAPGRGRQEREHRRRIAAAEPAARRAGGRRHPGGRAGGAGGPAAGPVAGRGGGREGRLRAAAGRGRRRPARGPRPGRRAAGAVGQADRRGALRGGAPRPADDARPSSWPTGRWRSSPSPPTS